jgi:hypothetical protein
MADSKALKMVERLEHLKVDDLVGLLVVWKVDQ